MPSNCATNISFAEYTWILESGITSTNAYRGRDARDAGNSNRSITWTNNVSDSFLNPVMRRGALRTVRDVEIRGEV